MVDLVKHPNSGKCIHQNIYDNPSHAYCSLMKQKNILCIHYLEEKTCPFYKEPEEVPND